MRELRHENLTPFVGVCVESGSACIVTAYCSRGSLATVLADRDLHLDDMFVASLVADLLRGLTYIHDSALGSHGNLTSSNCLVDRRWVLQITDYGLHTLKSKLNKSLLVMVSSIHRVVLLPTIWQKGRKLAMRSTCEWVFVVTGWT